MWILTKGSENCFREFLGKIVDIGTAMKLRSRPLEYLEQSELHKFGDRFSISPEGAELARLVEDFELLAKYSLNFSSPNFMAMPDCGHSIAGLLGDAARSFLNQNTVNVEYSPIASILEIRLLETLRSIVGFPLESNPDMLAVRTGGAFTFGGFGSNFSCLLIARELLKTRLRNAGKRFDPRRTRILGSRAFAHYSLRRSLDMLGLGNKDLSRDELEAEKLDEESLVNVETSDFSLNMLDLEQKIETTLERGDDIMAVFALEGDSRAMGFDDIKSIVRICRRYGIWVHVDACQGGQCLFSKKMRAALMNGIEDVDSISLDPHKVLMIPYNLSAFFVRDFEHMYLLPKGAGVISNDDDALGKFTPGIGSKEFMSLKLYFLLKHWGLQRLDDEIVRRHDLALQSADLIKANPHLVLLNPNVTHNAVVLMVRPAIRNAGVADFNKLNRAVYQRLTEEGEFFVHTFPTKDDCRILTDNPDDQLWPMRMMFGNPETEIKNVRRCLERIVEIGQEVQGLR